MNALHPTAAARRPAIPAIAASNLKRTDMENQKFELQVWGDITITHADGTTDEDNK